MNSIIEIVLIIAVVLIGVAIILLTRKKNEGQQTKAKQTIDKETYDKKMKEVKEAYFALKKAFNELKEKNRLNLLKIEEFKKKITELEEINAILLEKKRILSEQKIKLEKIQEQKDKLFAIAIHDIKNPINTIRGYVELIKSYDLTAREQQEVMDSMMRSSDKLVNIAQDMIEIIQAEEITSSPYNPASIKKIIDDVCKLNSAYVKKKQVNLINKTPVGLPLVEVDQAKIEEAIDNLVNNAIKYGPPGTTIEINAFAEDNEIKVEVSDDGVGLSEEDAQKAFTRGGILSTKPTSDESQTGMGLWIVRQIIEDHNGKVWVKSKLGEGSTFGFSIPLKRELQEDS